MILDSHHYVPVLKVKRGEKAALRSIDPGLRPRITPLLEIVERNPDRAPTVEAHLDTAFNDLAESVQLYPRCFLDAREIAPDGQPAAAAVFEQAAAGGIQFTPVTGLSRSADVDAALHHGAGGIALRLTRAELEEGGLATRLSRFIHDRGFDPEQTDLILDLGSVAQLVAEGVAALTEVFLAEIPDHGSWRSLTVSACAFPISMGGVERHSFSFADRVDWMAWRDGLYGHRGQIERLPTFSDAAIQHPSGVEGFDPRIMQVSAAIRYTLQQRDAWLLIKGASTRITPPSEQFPALATRLVYGAYRQWFRGESHCAGCRGMKAAADGAPRLGSAEAWRRLGTIPHITTVVESLTSLPWS
jgi:hypothetical protein